MKKSIIRVSLFTGLILMIPLVSMQFTSEVDWKLNDFIIMGVLLTTVGLIFEFVVNKIRDTRSKIIAGLILLAVFLLIWGELAVGIFGTPFAGS